MKPYNKSNISLAKVLRKNMTKEEKKLWYQFLRNYPVRFQRQKVIDNYIVDFYCAKAKLVIELDGSGHYKDNQEIYDKKRSEILNSLGLEVKRFNNLEIIKNFDGCCKMIDLLVKERIEKLFL